jgi:glycosyltransferase involved in cell wall biosynthesis
MQLMATYVDVVLPCLNEADALPWVIARLPAGCMPLVVDNGSTDATVEIATKLGARVVHEPHRGYGAAVHTGLLHATTPLVAVLDADGSLDPGVLPAMIRTITQDEADMVVGRRITVDRHVQPWHARAGNAAIAALLRHRGIPVHDIAPVRVADRAKLLDLGVTDRGFGYPLELLVRAGVADWRVREICVRYQARVGGRSKVSGSIPGTLRAVRDMARVISR